MGDPGRAATAFERALALEPDNWSVHLDLADVRAEQGDFAGAVAQVEQGLAHAPGEVSLRAAAAAYRTRLSGSSDDLRALITLAPRIPDPGYRNLLIDYACAAEGLPAERVAEARRTRDG
jgi:hypothetical protein